MSRLTQDHHFYKLVPNAVYHVSRSSAFWFWRKRFTGFYHIWMWQPSWSRNHDWGFRRNVLKVWTDGWRTEACYTVSSSCEPSTHIESPWTQWTLSMEIAWLEYWNKGPWTMSTESMDNVHWVHGPCPLNPWTMSTQSLGFPYTLFSIEL